MVPSFGSVGASGDLTPLAHVTLALMGEVLLDCQVYGVLIRLYAKDIFREVNFPACLLTLNI